MGGKSSRPKTLESLVGAGDLVDYDAERVPKRCYWDIVKEDRQGNPVEMGRVEFLLYQDTPLTSKNFGANCSGFKLEEPVVNRAGKSITVSVYSGVTFHRIIPKFMCQFGDTTEGRVDATGGRPGTGGASVYGSKFKDENFIHRHEVGCLSMANSGPDTNGSQIFVTTAPTDHLNDKHVVFGKVSKGMDVIREVEGLGTSSGSPKSLVYVAKSGIMEYY